MRVQWAVFGVLVASLLFAIIEGARTAYGRAISAAEARGAQEGVKLCIEHMSEHLSDICEEFEKSSGDYSKKF